MYGHILRLRFRTYAAALALAGAVAAAYAAPNPVSGAKQLGDFNSAAAHAILIDADSGPLPPYICLNW